VFPCYPMCLPVTKSILYNELCQAFVSLRVHVLFHVTRFLNILLSYLLSKINDNTE
jgi:hypothetical protein